MNVLRTDDFNSEMFRGRNQQFSGRLRKKTKVKEFDKVMEKTLKELNEDLEEFRVLLPKHGNFWDNGYEDLD